MSSQRTERGTPETTPETTPGTTPGSTPGSAQGAGRGAGEDRIITRGERIMNLVNQVEGPSEPPPELMVRPRRTLVRLVKDAWGSRQIAVSLAERNLRVRYKQSLLGIAWALLTPLALTGVLWFAFTRLGRLDTGGIPYPIFVLSALIGWTFFTASISTAATSVIADKALLNKCAFARSVFPIASVAVAGFDALVSMVPLVLLLVILAVPIKATVVWAPLLLVILVVATFSWALLLSSVTVYVRDVRLILPVVIQVGMFLTPVAYSLDVIPDRWHPWYALVNPVGACLDMLRSAVLIGDAPPPEVLLPAAGGALVMLIVCAAVFQRLEGDMADVA